MKEAFIAQAKQRTISYLKQDQDFPKKDIDYQDEQQTYSIDDLIDNQQYNFDQPVDNESLEGDCNSNTQKQFVSKQPEYKYDDEDDVIYIDDQNYEDNNYDNQQQDYIEDDEEDTPTKRIQQLRRRRMQNKKKQQLLIDTNEEDQQLQQSKRRYRAQSIRKSIRDRRLRNQSQSIPSRRNSRCTNENISVQSRDDFRRDLPVRRLRREITNNSRYPMENRQQYQSRIPRLRRSVNMNNVENLKTIQQNRKLRREVSQAQQQLSQINLFNQKMQYVHKIFQGANLSKAQKERILDMFDKATDLRQAKLVFQSITNSHTRKQRTQKTNVPTSLNQGKVTPRNNIEKIDSEQQQIIDRFKKIAGIK